MEIVLRQSTKRSIRRFIQKEFSMNKPKNAPIQTLDLDDFLGEDQSRRDAFVALLRTCLRHTGFFFLRNHGLNEGIINRAFSAFRDFFYLPEDIRLQYEFPECGRQWGYTPIGIEKGEHAQVADLKHFFHVPEDHVVDVAEVPHFSANNRALFRTFDECYDILLEAVASSLGLHSDFFSERAGNSLLRVLHYPANENPQNEDARVEEVTPGGNVVGMCASRHTDINMLTLLLARDPGLQLMHNGQWLPIHISDPDLLIVNCGDMLEHLTGGRYRSGEHRVVCEPGIERYSMPFFGHVHEDVSIEPLPHLGDSDRTRFRFTTAGEFLKDRLRVIGLLT